MVPWKLPKKTYEPGNLQHQIEDEKDVIYQRFYHVFIEGELDSLVDLNRCRILKTGFDRDNYYVIIEKLQC